MLHDDGSWRCFFAMHLVMQFIPSIPLLLSLMFVASTEDIALRMCLVCVL